MSGQLRLPLPVWHLQYQLLGGHRRMLLIVAGAVCILGVGIIGTHRLVGKPFSVIGGYVLSVLTGLQAIVTLLAGCNAIYRAMLRDHQSKMIESHRLTPMSNLAVAVGYLFGPTLQTLMLYVVFVAAGVVVSLASGLPVHAWIYGNVLLLLGAIMVWSFGVFLGMRPEKPINTAQIAVAVAALGFPIAFVPVLGLISGAYAVLIGIWIMSGQMSFSLRVAGALTGRPPVPPPVPMLATLIVAGVALAYACFWTAMAAMKYRRPDLPAINGARGLALLIMTMFIGAAGLAAFDYFTTSNQALNEFYERGMARVQWLATFNGGLLLAIVLTAGAVRCQVLGSRGTALRGRSDRMSPLTIALLSTALICAIMAGVGSPIWPRLLSVGRSDNQWENLLAYAPIWGWTVAACLLGTLSLRSVLEIGYRLLSSPRVLVIVFLVAAWAAPPAVDAARMEYVREFHGEPEYSWLTGACPPGMLVAIWAPLNIKLWPGLAAQAGLLLPAMLLARRARRRDGAADSDTLCRRTL